MLPESGYILLPSIPGSGFFKALPLESMGWEGSLMNVQSSRQTAKRQTPGQKFRKLLKSYNGPEDGRSHPKYTGLVRTLNKTLVAGRYRVEVSGAEIPDEESGGAAICPTHSSTMDPPLVASLLTRDTRSMAAYDQFQGLRGKVIQWGGAFPIYRKSPGREAVTHSMEVLREGKALMIYPEGGIPDEEKVGKVGPLKEGPAKFAVKAKAKFVQPIAIHYKKNDAVRPVELGLGLAASAGVAVAGVAAALSGNPLLSAGAGAVAGGLAGAFTGGSISAAITPEKDWWEPWPRYLSTLKGGAIGAAVGGLIGGAAGAFLPGEYAAGFNGLVGGVGTAALTNAWRTRDVAQVRIPEALRVDDYVEQYGRKEAPTRLTEDLHRALGKARAEMTGVPYDENSEKIS